MAEGRRQPPGLREYENRKQEKADYSYEERKDAKLTPEYEKRFKSNQAAWKFFQEQAPWYRRTAAFWVLGAKKEETRLRRLGQLIDDSANEHTIGPLRRSKG
ncbi:MAG: YdeI/OmpD-associated family protein [Acidobacteria bacterium]|nr:YdeI/OmpD-associated family protein [Acidobacteriota bacterium]